MLAVVTCDDGSEWPVKAAVPCRLLETNPRTVADPSLLRRLPRTEGFLAIVQVRAQPPSAPGRITLVLCGGVCESNDGCTRE